MTLSRHRVPPLSPVLLAGLALPPLPPLFLLPALSVAHGVMRRRHSGVFERLDGLGDALIAIDPVALPMVFLLRPGDVRPGLRGVPFANGFHHGGPGVEWTGPAPSIRGCPLPASEQEPKHAPHRAQGRHGVVGAACEGLVQGTRE